jgi:hypothetical protein
MRGAQDIKPEKPMLRLIRETQRSALPTIGYFETHPHRIFTLERPWVPCEGIESFQAPQSPPCGMKGVSCVPPGLYRLVPHNSEAHPHTVALVNPELWVYHFEEEVPPERRGIARTAVLIHPANRVEELRGCIAPGWERVGYTVQQSRRAFAQLAIEWPSELEIVSSGGV